MIKQCVTRLPFEYQEVEYIENYISEYIDTGLTGADMTGCEIEICMQVLISNANEFMLQGAYESGHTAQIGLVTVDENTVRCSMNLGFAEAVMVSGFSKADFHTLYLTNGLQKVDGTQVGTTQTVSTLTTNRFMIFGRTNGGASNITISKMTRIKYFWVKKNDEYLRYFIPCYRKADNEVGMYDIANDVFYTNIGDGAFIKGPDVNITHWNEVMYRQYGVNETLSPIPTTVFSQGDGIDSCTVYGNTVQNGIPSPDVPVDIIGVGDNSGEGFIVTYINTITGVTTKHTVALHDKFEVESPVDEVYWYVDDNYYSSNKNFSEAIFKNTKVELVKPDNWAPTASAVVQLAAKYVDPSDGVLHLDILCIFCLPDGSTPIEYGSARIYFPVGTPAPTAEEVYNTGKKVVSTRQTKYLVFYNNFTISEATSVKDGYFIAFARYTFNGEEHLLLSDVLHVAPEERKPSVVAPEDQYTIPLSVDNNNTDIYLGDTQSIRRIQKVILTGDESFYKNSGDNYLYYANRGVLLPGFLGNTQVMCNQLPYSEITPQYAIGINSINSYNVIYLNFGADTMNAQPSGNTVEGLKEYLASQYAAGTPVTVYYVRATPQTTTLNEPLMKIGDYADSVTYSSNIPTTYGQNDITTDTQIKPSKLDITYNALRRAKVYKNNRWILNPSIDWSQTLKISDLQSKKIKEMEGEYIGYNIHT